MATNVEITRALYRALEDGDVQALLELLHPRFTGSVTEGLPCELGGRYDGPQAMIALWARVLKTFDIRPRPRELLSAQDDRVVVLGRYVGKAVGTGKPVDAAFVHIVRIEEQRISAMEQITDSRRWSEALDSSGGAEVVRQVMRAVSSRDLDAVLRHYAPDIEIHEAPSLPYGGVHRGHGGATEHAYGYVSTWDSLQSDADRDLDLRVIGDGDCVAALWRQKATDRDGSRLDSPAISLFELAGDRVTRLRMFHFDTAALAELLAASPESSPRRRP